MPYSLTWLSKALSDAGLRVAEMPGWQDRGVGDLRQPYGVLCHHTAGPRLGIMPSLATLVEGRPGLHGPLAHLGLGRDGTYFVIAAGKAQHAGQGMWAGVTGNDHFIGIEAENSGRDDDSWPEVQMRAYQHGVAAILKHLGLDADRCAGHKEYAPGRKIDPLFDMDKFRNSVRDILAGRTPAPTPIPSVEPTAKKRPTLQRGMTRPEVRDVQQRLQLSPTGTLDASTEARIRDFQRDHALVPDGIVGPKTWAALDGAVMPLARVAGA